jgi:toxin ParE1/3/4
MKSAQSIAMIKHYKLSRKAERDIFNIIDYSAATFGLKKAKSYYDSLKRSFDLIVQNPNIGRNANEAGEGLHRYIHQKHIVLYRIKEDKIAIVRVIHHSEDSENYNL